MRTQKSYGLLVVLLSIVWASCKPGVEYADLPLDPLDFIDYGAKLSRDAVGPGSKAYAFMRQKGPEKDGVRQINAKLVVISAKLNELKELPATLPEISFDPSQKKHIENFVAAIEQKIATEITPKIIDATQRMAAAKELQNQLQNFLKRDGYLANKVSELKKNIPDAALAAYEGITTDINNNFGKIYQFFAVYPYSRTQTTSSALLFRLKIGFDKLKVLEDNNSFEKADDKADAKAARLSAVTKREELESLVLKMPSSDMVKEDLIRNVTEFKSALVGLRGLEGRFVRRVSETYRVDAQNIFNEALKITDELLAVFKEYDESSKRVADQSLRDLHKNAQGKSSPLLLSTKKSDETELIQFMRILSQSRILGLRANEASESFIEALAVSALTPGMASTYSLSIANICVLNDAKLNATKTTFGMDDEAFGIYVRSIATKGYERTSQKGILPVVYVLFADRLAPGVDIQELIKIFSQGKTRLILVANRPVDYKINASYELKGLDLYSAIEVANATLSITAPQLSEQGYGEIIAKLMYAFKKSSDEVNLLSIEKIAKDVALRVAEKDNPSEKDMLAEIQEALQASKEGYGYRFLASSSAIIDDPATVIANVQKNASYYEQEVMGFLRSIREREALRQVDSKKYEDAEGEDDSQLGKTQKLSKLLEQVKETERQLLAISSSIDSTTAEGAARQMFIEELAHLFTVYGKLTSTLYELSDGELRAFFNGPKNNFKIFFQKIITILNQPINFAYLKDVKVNQANLRRDLAVYLPEEITSMLNRYSAWHPAAYFGAATGAAFDTRFKGKAPTAAEVQKFYDAKQAKGLFNPPTDEIKRAIIDETKGLVALAGSQHTSAKNARKALRESTLAIPWPSPLASPRFEAGSNGKKLLASQNEAIKSLILLWPKLLDLTRELERSSEQVYLRLTKISKK